jgi:hypothetical protein
MPNAYCAETLFAQWMGANAGDLNTVFPNLHNFPVTDLGFLT